MRLLCSQLAPIEIRLQRIYVPEIVKEIFHNTTPYNFLRIMEKLTLTPIKPKKAKLQKPKRIPKRKKLAKKLQMMVRKKTPKKPKRRIFPKRKKRMMFQKRKLKKPKRRIVLKRKHLTKQKKMITRPMMLQQTQKMLLILKR